MKAKKKQSNKTSKTPKEKKVPYQYKPDNMSYDEWQIALRRQFGVKQEFSYKNIGEHKVYSDFEVFNAKSGKKYKTAIRSKEAGLNFCSCPDFKINDLGTCKHIEFMLDKLKNGKGLKRLFNAGFTHPYSSICLKYTDGRNVILRVGQNNKEQISQIAGDYFDNDNILNESKFHLFEEFLEKAYQIDPQFKCYDDAISYINQIRDKEKRIKHIDENYPSGQFSDRLNDLLKTDLYIYQKEAILFAAKAGRSLLADDMGLGKTIQAIGLAEFMKREFGIQKVLIVCPTSLKHQWQSEIAKFTNSASKVVEGNILKRKKIYQEDQSFFKISSYHIIHNDLEPIEKWQPDLVILDEAQKIKNWDTRTAKKAKEIKSPYALVLTGTPLENKLEELYSIVSFINPYKLGPLFRFLSSHSIFEEDSTKVIGYKDLSKISKNLSDIMLRRTKKQVLQELPKKTEENIFVPITEKQKQIHDEDYEKVTRLVNKWRKYRFLSEQERQILLLCLNRMRMVCNSTYILDQKTRHDTKIKHLREFIEKRFLGNQEKMIIFSSWERMTRLIAQELEELNIKYEYLHGGIHSSNRKKLLENFKNDPNSRIFLSTDAGGVGLNMQNASIVVNMECPWNPAVLEQRIGRAYRLGQTKIVSVINFITKDSFEEKLLNTIIFKKSLFSGVLDNGQDQVFMSESKFDKFISDIINVTDDNNSSNNNKEDKNEADTTSDANNQEHKKQIERNFLTKINDLILTKGVSSFIKKAKFSSKKYLKIPIEKNDPILKLKTKNPKNWIRSKLNSILKLSFFKFWKKIQD